MTVQATKNIGPLKSGIYTIPLVLSLVVASIVSAAFTQRVGYYVPAMLLCPAVMAAGEGLLSTFKPNSGAGQWIGYQVVTGFGLGLGMQTGGLAVQATLPRDDVSTGMAITFFCQQLGGAIFVSVGQTVLNKYLVQRLNGIAGLDPETIVRTGATDLHEVVPAQYLGRVVDAYNYACKRILLVDMGIALGGIFCAVSMKWVSIKKGKGGPPGPPGAGGPPGGPPGPTQGQTEKAKVLDQENKEEK